MNTCLQARVTKAAANINVTISQVCNTISLDSMHVHTECKNGLNVDTFVLSQTLHIASINVAQHIKVYCNIVCSAISSTGYLEVSTDTLWLTPDMIGGEFDIYSNVVWKIDQ